MSEFQTHIWRKVRQQVVSFQILKSAVFIAISLYLLFSHKPISIIAKIESNLFFLSSVLTIISAIVIFAFANSLKVKFKNFKFEIYLYLLLEILIFFTDYTIAYFKFPIEGFAYYRIAVRELPIAIFFTHLVSNEILKRITPTNILSPLAELRSEIYRLIFRFFPLSIFIILISHPILIKFLQDDFNIVASLINYTLLLLIVNILQPEFILLQMKMKRHFLLGKSFQITLNIALSILFSNLIGLQGIILATTISLLIGKLYFIFVLFKKKNLKLNAYFPLNQYLIFTIVLLIAFIFVEFEII